MNCVESGTQTGERAVVVEMVRLDVGQDGPVGAQRLEGPEALVGLHDEPLPAVPHGVRADLVHVGADEEGGAQARLYEDEREHRRRGGLSLRSGHGEAASGGADGGQDAGPGHDAGAPLGGGDDLDVGGRHGGRVRDGIDLSHVLSPVADGNRDPLRAQPGRHR